MHSLKTGKVTDQFIEMLMNAVPNLTFSVLNRSPADLIQRCHLRDGGLKELFFGDCTKRHVAFNGARIERQSKKKKS
jgi:hypothetical protein